MLQKIKKNQKSVILSIGIIIAVVVIITIVSGELANKKSKSSVASISYDTVETVCSKIEEKIKAEEKSIKDTFTITRESEFNINMVDKFINNRKYKITDVKFDVISDNECKLTLTVKKKFLGVI